MELLNIAKGWIALLLGIFAVVKVFANQKALSTIMNNDIHHVVEDMKEIKNDVDENKSNIAKLYTDVGKIDTRCEERHK